MEEKKVFYFFKEGNRYVVKYDFMFFLEILGKVFRDVFKEGVFLLDRIFFESDVFYMILNVFEKDLDDVCRFFFKRC